MPGKNVASDILTGAGATFPAPLYQEWFKRFKNQTGIRINYSSTGSGDGIRQILGRTVDFGATDVIMSEAEKKTAPARIIHIPTCMGAVAVIYNLPDIENLRLTPELIADIFMGRIVSWTDRRLGRANPSVSFPRKDIAVVHRSEASGTSYIFTDYLSRVSPQWQSSVGRGKKVRWPAGMGVEGNPGVARMVGHIEGAIGFVQLSFAEHNKLPTASIQNRAHAFVKPSMQTVTAAAEQEPLRRQGAQGDSVPQNGYPISSFTYLVVYHEQAYNGRTPSQAQALARWLRWCINEGQAHTTRLLYAPLPPQVIRQAQEAIDSLVYQDKPIVNQQTAMKKLR
ncbi:MAG: phosphate ABC transporter substrate-binding protein PstS [Chitinivibrionales bacterium]